MSWGVWGGMVESHSWPRQPGGRKCSYSDRELRERSCPGDAELRVGQDEFEVLPV